MNVRVEIDVAAQMLLDRRRLPRMRRSARRRPAERSDGESFRREDAAAPSGSTQRSRNIENLLHLLHFHQRRCCGASPEFPAAAAGLPARPPGLLSPCLRQRIPWPDKTVFPAAASLQEQLHRLIERNPHHARCSCPYTNNASDSSPRDCAGPAIARWAAPEPSHTPPRPRSC